MSLASCLKDSNLTKEDKNIIKSNVNKYLNEGFSQEESELKAVRDYALLLNQEMNNLKSILNLEINNIEIDDLSNIENNIILKSINGYSAIIPEDYLKAFGYRIPTNGYNTMSAIEIVGFLPRGEETGIIAPREFITQMSSDFDVDKLNLFSYEVDQDENGKIIKKESDNNKLLDLELEIMSNKEVFKLTMEPLSTDKLKEQIKQEESSPIDKIYDQNYANKYNESLDGASGIGSFATLGTFLSVASNIEEDITYKDEKTLDFSDLKGNNINNPFALDGRTKIQISSQFLQASLDNENDPILGKINANKNTFGAIQAMISRGYNEEQIVSFINQPVIRDYLKNLQFLLENNDEFESDLKGKAFERTIGSTLDTNEKVQTPSIDQVGKDEFREINLRHFLRLQDAGKELQKVKSTINTDSTLAPKSLLESFDKETAINNLSESTISNADKLLGIFEEVDGVKQLKPEGISGLNSYYGIIKANEIWTKLQYPYQQSFFQGVFENLSSISGKDLTIEEKQEVSKNIKDYAYTAAIQPILTDNIYKERERLLVGKNSLAKRVEKAKAKIKNNIFLDLLYTQKKDNGIDTINFNNAAMQGLNEEYIYNSFVDLIIGKNTTTLAQDLILYSFITNTNINPRSFVKFIPAEYITSLGINKSFISTFKDENIDSFISQLIQNNPRFANRITPKEGNSFYESNKNNRQEYKSFFDTEGKVWKLFSHQGDGKYERINLLGKGTLIKEYDYRTPFFQSVLKKNNISNTTIAASQEVNIDTNKQSYLIELNTESSNDLTKSLLQINPLTKVDRLNKNQRQLLDLFNKIKVNAKVQLSDFNNRGSYDPDNNIITINNSLLENQFIDTYIHEYIHALTSNKVNQYFKDKSKLSENERKFIAQIEGIRVNYFEQLAKDDLTTYNSFDKKLQYLRSKDQKDKYLDDPFTPEERKFYNISNTKEFITSMFTEQVVIDDLNNRKFEGNKSLIERFIEVISNFLASFNENIKSGSELEEAIRNSLALIQDQFSSIDTNLKSFINHSGGAIGSDTEWGEIGREFGMINNKHYYFEGNKTPNGNTAIKNNSILKEEANKKLNEANKVLNRKFPTSNDYVNNLLRRNWLQVKNSDSIFAISTINDNKVSGGTGWAVHMAINENKPVYVFDQDKNKWFTWKYNQDLFKNNIGGEFIETQTPMLTVNFAGIGTRKINNNGKNAIRNVYLNTLENLSNNELSDQDILNIANQYDLSPLSSKDKKLNEINLQIKKLEKDKEFKNRVSYQLKAINILQSQKADEIFRKGDKNNWDLEKILQELQVPKEQKQLILSKNTRNREEIITSLLADNSFVVEVNTAKETPIKDNETRQFNLNGFAYRQGFSSDGRKRIFEKVKINDITLPPWEPDFLGDNEEISLTEEEFIRARKEANADEGNPTQHYSNLTVPGGTNYTENEIATPDITPNIKGHAQFSTDNGIGWFRSDESDKVLQKGSGNIPLIQNTKTRRILEVQSDLFQKGRDKDKIVNWQEMAYDLGDTKTKQANDFLQLLNKNNNWVTFFVKSIIQDSAKKGYEKVLFPKGDTAAKIEGHQTLEEFKKQKEARIKEIENKLENLPENATIVKKQSLFELKRVKQELADVESGQTQLSSIANFYEETVSNVLKKNGYNPVEITDEYGNKWNEVNFKDKVFNKAERLYSSYEEAIEYQIQLNSELQGEKLFAVIREIEDGYKVEVIQNYEHTIDLSPKNKDKEDKTHSKVKDIKLTFQENKLVELEKRIKKLRRNDSLKQAIELEQRVKELKQLSEEDKIEDFTIKFINGFLTDLTKIQSVVNSTKDLHKHPRFQDIVHFIYDNENIFRELGKIFNKNPKLREETREVFNEVSGTYNEIRPIVEDADRILVEEFQLTNEFGETEDNAGVNEVRKDINFLQFQAGNIFNLNHPLIKNLAYLITRIKAQVDIYANRVGRDLIKLQTEFVNSGGKITDLIDGNSLISKYNIEEYERQRNETYNSILELFSDDRESAEKLYFEFRQKDKTKRTPEEIEIGEIISDLWKNFNNEYSDLSKYKPIILDIDEYDNIFIGKELDIKVPKDANIGDIRVLSIKDPKYKGGLYRVKEFIKVKEDNKVEVIDSTELGLSDKLLNPKYEVIKDNKYYNKLREILENEKNKLPIQYRIGKHKYMLPQIEEDYMNYIKRGKFKDGFKQWKREFGTREDDTAIFGESQGYKDYMLPVHYVHPIDSKNLSTDLAYTFREFSRMAEQFSKFKEEEGTINSVKRQIGESEFIKRKHRIKGVESNTYKMMESFLERFVYDVHDNTNIEVGGLNVSKVVDYINGWIRNTNLGFNFPTQIAGQLHAELDFAIERMVGEFTDKEADNFAIKEVLKNMQGLTETISRSKVRTNKLGLMLDDAGMISSPKVVYGDSNIDNKLSRMLDSELFYLSYAPGDFELSGRILIALMYNTRYINSKWIYKDQYEGKKDFNSFPNMYDQISSEGNQIVYSDILKESNYSEVILKAQKLSARIEGRLNPYEKGVISRNALGRMILTHRSWLQSGFEYRFKARQTDRITGQEEEGTLRTLYRIGLEPMFRAMLTKEANLKDALLNWKNLNEFERRQLKRVLIDLVNLSLITGLAMILNGIDADDDDFMLNFIAYTSNRLMLEQSAFWSPNTFFELTDSPAAGVDTIKDTMNMLRMFTDFEPLQSGIYEDHYRFTRFLIQRGSPFKNIYELTSLDQKNKSLDQITNPPFFVDVPLSLVLEDEE